MQANSVRDDHMGCKNESFFFTRRYFCPIAIRLLAFPTIYFQDIFPLPWTLRRTAEWKFWSIKMRIPSRIWSFSPRDDRHTNFALYWEHCASNSYVKSSSLHFRSLVGLGPRTFLILWSHQNSENDCDIFTWPRCPWDIKFRISGAENVKIWYVLHRWRMK